jgi:hypothetical protein
MVTLEVFEGQELCQVTAGRKALSNSGKWSIAVGSGGLSVTHSA